MGKNTIVVEKFTDTRGAVVQKAEGPIGEMEQHEIAGYHKWLSTMLTGPTENGAYMDAYRRWIESSERDFEQYAKPRLFHQGGNVWRYTKLQGWRKGKRAEVWFREFCYFDYSLWLKDNPHWVSQYVAKIEAAKQAAKERQREKRQIHGGRAKRPW